MVWVAVLSSLLLLILSVPVFLVFGIGSSLVAILGLDLPWSTLIQVSFGAVTRQILLAIPLFIFAGLAMLRGGVARRLVDLMVALVGHWPGGLGIAMVLTMGFFAAFCGSILAAITAVGTILMPVMIERGYPKPFVITLAAAAALVEALIPPSNAAIIYSSLTHVPVSKTFAAGFLPGLVLMALLIVLVVWRCRDMERSPRATTATRIAAFKAAIPGLMTPVVILGGIYTGLLTASESAAAAGVWAIFVGTVIHRELTWRGLSEALEGTAISTTIIFAIIAMATFLSVVLTFTQAPQALIAYFTGFGVTPLTFLVIVGVVCLILGTFIEIVPVFYLTVPVFAVIAGALDIDLVYFYVVFVAFAGIGQLTPPVCVSIYTAASVVRESADTAFREVPVFILLGLIYATIIIAFPFLSTWLPSVLP
jgi:C4-dicarboxylate transporter, DctM subunit